MFTYFQHTHIISTSLAKFGGKRMQNSWYERSFSSESFFTPKTLFFTPKCNDSKVFLDSTKNKQKKQFFFLFTFCLSFFSFILWLFLLTALISCLQKIVLPYIKTKNSTSHEIRPYYNYDMKTSTFSHRILGSVAIVTNKI